MRKKIILFVSLSAFVFIPSFAFAYNFYNETTETMYVVDDTFSGMKATILPHSYASCDPQKRGCYGNMSFKVYTLSNHLVARWEGQLKKEKGNYFVLKFYRDDEDTVGSYYGIKHYHD